MTDQPAPQQHPSSAGFGVTAKFTAHEPEASAWLGVEGDPEEEDE